MIELELEICTRELTPNLSEEKAMLVEIQHALYWLSVVCFGFEFHQND